MATEKGVVRVRLAGIYAAELDQPGGPEAKERLAALMNGRKVTLVVKGRDHYGRTLADVLVDGKRVTQTGIGPRSGNGSQRR